MNYTTHRDYNKYAPSYIKDEECYGGQEEVKKRKQKYLPMLPAMAADRVAGELLYESFLSGASWFPATSQTVNAYLGMMFRKEPQIEVPEELAYVTESMTDKGQPINTLAKNLAKEVMIKYRPAVLVDYPAVDTTEMTNGQVKELNLKPYAVMYTSLDIIYWHEKIVNGYKKLDVAFISEKHDIGDFSNNNAVHLLGDSLYIEEGQYHILRVLKLITVEGQDIYVNELYIKRDKKKLKKGQEEWILLSSSTPLMNGKPLDYIPFVPCSEEGTQWELDYSLINDVVDLNITDFQNDALYRDNLKFLGRPTPVFSGLLKEEGKDGQFISLGSSSFIELEQGGTAELLGGDSTQSAALKLSGNDLKRELATIGLRSLAADPTGVETATTALIHRAGEHGILSSISNSVSECITKVLIIMGNWANADISKVSYSISNDFIPVEMDSNLLTTLWQMYVSGALPLSQYLNKLKKGEIVDPALTEDEFIEQTSKNLSTEVVDNSDPVEEVIRGD